MLYPPILENTQPVFLIGEYDDDTGQANFYPFNVNFTLSSITSPSEISSIELIVSQQSNNQSVLDLNKYPTGVMTGIAFNENDLRVELRPKEDFDPERWNPGSLYKVQMRFKQDNANNPIYSEWSTVMIIKPIQALTLEVQKEDNVLVNTRVTMTSSLTPSFIGVCSIPEINKEIEQYYRFSIYQGEATEENLIETLGWRNHVTGQVDLGYFETTLDNRESYIVIYEVKTNNGYETSTGPINFVAIQSTIGDLEGINFSVQPDVTNAAVNVYVQSDTISQLTGNFVIARTSSKSNFKRYEDIKFVNYVLQNIANPLLIFTDYSIESGVTYRYSFQQINWNFIRTNALYSEQIVVDFESAYLYHNGVQLRLGFNNAITSFKHTVLRSKQDTLGDKYPHFLQNGNAYYAEFPISGLISFQDNLQTFFRYATSGVYYQDDLIIESNKFEARAGENLRSSTSAGAALSLPVGFEHKAYYDFEDAATQNYADADDSVATANRRSGSNPHYVPEPAQPIGPLPHVDYSISTDLTDNNIYIERKFREKVEEFLNEFNYKLFKSPTEGNIVITLMNVSLKPNESLGRMLYEFSATAYETLENDLDELDKHGVIDKGEVIDIAELAPTMPSFGQVAVPQGENIDIFNLIANQEHQVISELYEYTLQKLTKVWIEARSDSVTTSPLMLKIGIDNKQTQVVVPFDRIYTLNEEIPNSFIMVNSNYPIVVNYLCNLQLDERTNIEVITSVETQLDFNQLVWRLGSNNNLLQLIKNKIKIQLGANLVEQADGTWKDPDHNIVYKFSGLNSIDIEAQQGTTIEIGESDTNYNTYIIGLNSGGERIRFDSTRIFFPDVLAHAQHLFISNAAYALINFTYYIETRIYTEI